MSFFVYGGIFIEYKHDRYELDQIMQLSLESKIIMTKQRIKEWYEHFDGKVYVSFSGGKDSTVLLHLAREMYPDIEAVYCDMGLDYPELKEYIKSFKNVTVIKPEKSFKEIVLNDGYPYPSKEVARKIRYFRYGSEWVKKYIDGSAIDSEGRKSFYCLSERHLKLIDSNYKISEKCCDYMKKRPFKKYQKKTGKYPIIGLLADESFARKISWMRNGCNAFNGRNKRSMPMAFWSDNDVLQYIVENNIKIAPVYGQVIIDGTINKLGKEYPKYTTTGVERTGCIFCMFGILKENHANRFELLKETHPNIYNYCMKPIKNGGLGMDEFLNFVDVKH